MKAAELRQAILQAAFQGKLVPQNVHDEPASELLQRIRQEKVQHVTEGEIKGEKPLPLITEDELPFDLPDGWIWCRLVEICSHIADIDHNMPPAVAQGGVLFLSAKDLVDNGTINYTDRVKYISESDYERYGKKVKPQRNDIIYSRIGACLGKARIVCSDIKFLVSYSCCTIRSLIVNLQYLCRYLDSGMVLKQATRDTQSIGVPDLGIKKIKEFLVPLPPLAEQQCIVDKVEELMMLCSELEAAEEDLNKLESRFTEYLPKSILQAAVQGKLVPQNIHDEPASELLKRIQQEKARLVKEGKIKKEKQLQPITEDEIPYQLPNGWVWCRLSDIGEIVGGATPLTTEKAYYTEQGKGIAWVTPADMKHSKGNMISRGRKDITDAGYESCSTRLLPAGSIVFSSRAPIGLIAFAQNELCTNQGFKSIIPHQISMSGWLFYALKSMTEGIVSRASGTTFLEVSGEFMRKEIFPLPSLAEQQRIVAKVDELMRMCNELLATRDSIPRVTPPNIVPFQRQAPQADEEILFAARGDGEDLPQEALDDLAALWGDDDNA